jgi:hypothetical protein
MDSRWPSRVPTSGDDGDRSSARSGTSDHGPVCNFPTVYTVSGSAPELDTLSSAIERICARVRARNSSQRAKCRHGAAAGTFSRLALHQRERAPRVGVATLTAANGLASVSLGPPALDVALSVAVVLADHVEGRSRA